MTRKSRREVEHRLDELTRDGDDGDEYVDITVITDFSSGDTVRVGTGETERELTYDEFREEFGQSVDDIEHVADFSATTT